jgi:transcriptional regulator with XRE-family HTH domain
VSDNAPASRFLDLVEATLAQQGKTKTWLAQRSEVSRATINNWRKQPRTPQAASVLAIADVLGIGHDEALRLSGLPRAEQPPADTTDLSALPLAAIVEEIHRLTGELARRAAN